MMNTKKIEHQIELNFRKLKGLSCRIVKGEDEIYSVSAFVYHCVNVPEKLLRNSDNYPLIARDIEILAEESKE